MATAVAGLRRQLTFNEAAQLALVEGPPLTYDSVSYTHLTLPTMLMV